MVSAAPSRFGALTEREFRLLWLGHSASAIGNGLVPVALAFAVLGLTGSAADLGIVLAASTISRVAFFLVGGVWSDRLPRRRVMVACDVVRSAGQAFLAAVLLAGVAEVWMIVAAGATFGAASAFFGPASTGLVPQTVSPGRLQQANALMGFSWSATGIFGPALSGVLVAAFGPGWVFAVDAATFAASAGFLLALRLPTSARAERQTFLADLAHGWREVRSRTWISASLVAFSVSNLSVAVFFVLGPLVVQRELGGAADWGWILTGAAVGGMLGGAVALRFRPRHLLVPAFLAILFVALELGSLVRPFPAAAIAASAGLALGGIALANTLWHTALQQHVPEETLSRVSAYDWMISFVFMPIGYSLAGPLSETVGIDETLIGAAALTVVANAFVLAVPAVRTLRRLDEEPRARRRLLTRTAGRPA